MCYPSPLVANSDTLGFLSMRRGPGEVQVLRTTAQLDGDLECHLAVGLVVFYSPRQFPRAAHPLSSQHPQMPPTNCSLIFSSPPQDFCSWSVCPQGFVPLSWLLTHSVCLAFKLLKDEGVIGLPSHHSV